MAIQRTETGEGYIGPHIPRNNYPTEEIDRDVDAELLDMILMTPHIFTSGGIRAYKITSRRGIIYIDTKTHRFISKKGLAEIAAIPLNL